MISQFNKDNDVFSDCGIRRRCAPNHFQRAQNKYRKRIFYISDGFIPRAFSRRNGIIYRKTLIFCSNPKISFCSWRTINE